MSGNNGSFNKYSGEKPYFYTEDGRKVNICSISLADLKMAEIGIREEYKARGEPIDPPTYETLTAGGDKIKHVLDETCLVKKDDPEETTRRTMAWFAYQDALSRMQAEIGSVTNDIILDGIDEPLPADDSWVEKKKKRHINVPSDPEGKLKAYKVGVVLRTPRDFLLAQQAIIFLSSSGSVSKEALEAAGESFLRSIQGIAAGPAEQVDTAGSQGAIPGNIGNGPLDAQPDVKPSRRRSRLAGKTAK